MLLSLLASRSGNGPPPTAVDLRPEPLDEVIAAMRPTGRLLATLVVSPDGPGDFRLISDAVAEAKAIQEAQRIEDGLPTLTPNHRVDIIVRAGDYVDTVRVRDFIGIYGEGPAAVTVTQDTSDLADGTFQTWGQNWVEGMTIIKGDGLDAKPKYPIHHTGLGTSVFADLRLWSIRGYGTPEYNPYAHISIGTDIEEDSYTLMYRCDLIGGTNNHTWRHSSRPSRWAYVECTVNTTLNYSNPSDANLADEVWVTGCDAEEVSVTGVNTRLHLDPASTVTGTVTAEGPVDADTTWPRVVGGLDDYWRAYYGM